MFTASLLYLMGVLKESNHVCYACFTTYSFFLRYYAVIRCSRPTSSVQKSIEGPSSVVTLDYFVDNVMVRGSKPKYNALRWTYQTLD